MADIFISYKKEEVAAAKLYAEQFKAEGFSVWWDDDIRPEKSWDATIEEQITQASVVVVLWSPRATQSEWVRKEAHFAHDHSKLVPIFIEMCQLPLAFTLVQTINLAGWSGNRQDAGWIKLLTWITDIKNAGKDGAGQAVTQNKYRRQLGVTATGEAIFDGGAVTLATPAGTLFRDDENAPRMRILPKGDFMIGAPPYDAERTVAEGPQKRISIAYPFAISIFPTTNAELNRHAPHLRQAAPGSKKDTGGKWSFFAAKPVEAAPVAKVYADPAPCTDVSFDDARDYIAGLSAATKTLYDLPSESEWEYACRAGTTTRYWFGDHIEPENACYGRRDKGPVACGHYPANVFGVFDMHGNVREWTLDYWHDNYEAIPPDGSPALQSHTSMRVTRGGGWSDLPSALRSSFRSRATQSLRSDLIGFRVVRKLS